MTLKEIKRIKIVGTYEKGIIRSVFAKNTSKVPLMDWSKNLKRWVWNWHNGLYESPVSEIKIESVDFDFIKMYLTREYKIIFDHRGRYSRKATKEIMLHENYNPKRRSSNV